MVGGTSVGRVLLQTGVQTANIPLESPTYDVTNFSGETSVRRNARLPFSLR